jgi:two-component system nitrate/nitrite response regulator NarL
MLRDREKMKLSPRECDCLGLLAQGYSRKQVAGKLSVAISTIHALIERIKRKLNVEDLQQALQRAHLEKIID